MDYLKKYVDQISARIFLAFLFVSLTVTATWWVLDNYLEIDPVLTVMGLAIAGLILSLVATLALAKTLSQPLNMVARVLAYKIQPNYSDTEPDYKHISIGRELVTALAQQIYDLSSAGASLGKSTSDGDYGRLFDNIPLPIIAVDKDGKIKFANRASNEYFKLTSAATARPLVDVANLMFQNNHTYETWLAYCRQNKVIDTRSWYRVRAVLPDRQGYRQFDLSASFMKDAPGDVETVLALFDQTEHYNQDDQQLSLVALVVHELRTPLTVMRGYIEVFEEELGDSLSEEMRGFMHKMSASAQQLSTFVSNILNVARVEENQLMLSLHEEKWEPILRAALADLEMRARVRGKQISVSIDPNLPTVAADRVSIHEVVNNLIDNAIKYSGDSTEIQVISKLNAEGLVETQVIDHGVGIPVGVLPHLFEKFYRSHRTKGAVGGSGLGLYLSKAIMDAHGGTLTVNTKEGQGSTFSFGLQQFSNVKDEAKKAGPDGIMRGAHGWIKNHNLYR